jgi:hypothetical protein
VSRAREELRRLVAEQERELVRSAEGAAESSRQALHAGLRGYGSWLLGGAAVVVVLGAFALSRARGPSGKNGRTRRPGRIALWSRAALLFGLRSLPSLLAALLSPPRAPEAHGAGRARADQARASAKNSTAEFQARRAERAL